MDIHLKHFENEGEDLLDKIAVRVDGVDAFVSLLKEYGYEDPDGQRYRFESAVLIRDGILEITLQKELPPGADPRDAEMYGPGHWVQAIQNKPKDE